MIEWPDVPTSKARLLFDGKNEFESEFQAHARSSSEMTASPSFRFPSSPSDPAILFLSFLCSADFGPKLHVLALLTKH